VPVLVNKQIRLVKRPSGLVVESDFERTEEEIAPLKDGQVLIKHLYLALDPALRNWMDDYAHSYLPPVELGDVMGSICLGKVVESRHPDFQAGDITWGLGGWEQYRIMTADSNRQVQGLMVMHPDPDLPLSHYLSVCGTTGLTGYFGMLEVGQPKAGENILISGAAGAVGSVAGQVAKSAVECNLVGIAGSDEKCQWLRDELGFDKTINYKTCTDMSAAISAACPGGIDVFFDNVGGDILNAAIMNLNFRARILMCGAISQYNREDHYNQPGPTNLWQLLVKNARIEGFTVAYYAERWAEATITLEDMVKSGELKFKEEVVEGLENAISAFQKLFSGANSGRLIVKLADVND
jgi:NADPH-dependent curcumin reductase CurA